jgi:RES domain
MSQELDQIAVQLSAIPGFGLDEVHHIINTLNNMSPEDISVEQASDAVSKLAYYHFMFPYGFTSDLNFWRVRRSGDAPKLFTHAKDLGYPPSEKSPLQRMNAKGESVFYGASSESTAFAESRLEEKEVFHLTKYKIKEGKTLTMGVMGDIDSLRRHGSTMLKNKSYEEAYNYIFDTLDDDVLWSIYLVDAFFSDWMLRKGDDYYSVTSAIAKEFFCHRHCSGLIYPSVLHDGGHNYAIKSSAYDESIAPVHTQACMSGKHYGYELRRVRISDKSENICSKGEITWPKAVADNALNEFSASQNGAFSNS